MSSFKTKNLSNYFNIFIQVFYDNANHDGQMLVTMKIKLLHKECDEGSSFNSDGMYV